MKTISPVLLVILCHSLAFAQPTEEQISRTIFKISPQQLTINTLKAGIERFNKTYTASWVIFASATSQGQDYSSTYTDKLRGLGGELQYRKYLGAMKEHASRRHRYARGIYLMGFIQGAAYSNHQKGLSGSYVGGVYATTPYDFQRSIGNWGGGFALGFQRTFWNIMFLDVYIGGGVQGSDVIYQGQLPHHDWYHWQSITEPDYAGIIPKIGLQIGVGL